MKCYEQLTRWWDAYDEAAHVYACFGAPEDQMSTLDHANANVGYNMNTAWSEVLTQLKTSGLKTLRREDGNKLVALLKRTAEMNDLISNDTTLRVEQNTIFLSYCDLMLRDCPKEGILENLLPQCLTRLRTIIYYQQTHLKNNGFKKNSTDRIIAQGLMSLNPETDDGVLAAKVFVDSHNLKPGLFHGKTSVLACRPELWAIPAIRGVLIKTILNSQKKEFTDTAIWWSTAYPQAWSHYCQMVEIAQHFIDHNITQQITTQMLKSIINNNWQPEWDWSHNTTPMEMLHIKDPLYVVE